MRSQNPRPVPAKNAGTRTGHPRGLSSAKLSSSLDSTALRKLLFIAVLVPILGGLGWWYFREQQMPDYGPAFREYAYVSNGKSNTVSVIDLRFFRLAKTIHVGSDQPASPRTARRMKSM